MINAYLTVPFLGEFPPWKRGELYNSVNDPPCEINEPKRIISPTKKKKKNGKKSRVKKKD